MFKKILISFSTPFSGPPTADQMFGHIVWAVSDLRGEQCASELVSRFTENPPFLISAALPDGFLPVPMYAPSKPQDNTQEARHNAKRFKKAKWVSLDAFARIQRQPALFYKENLLLKQPNLQPVLETHVSINRLTGSVDQESDSSLRNERYVYSYSSFVCYINILDMDFWNAFNMDEILEYLSAIGIGGNRNVGRGVCDVKLSSLSDIEEKVFSYTSSSFLTLSRCSGKDLLDSAIAYRVIGYAGIVGGGNTGLFNKKPIIMFEVGSSFSAGKGALIQDIHPNNEIAYYCYAFPLYLDMEDKP